MPRVTVNGKITDAGERSPVIIVVRPGPDHAAITIAAEEFIRQHAGMQPSTWTDGTATTTLVASQVPVSCPLGHQKPAAGCTWCEENIDPDTWRERWSAPS